MLEDTDDWVLGVMDEGFDVFRWMWLWPKRGKSLSNISETFGAVFVAIVSAFAFAGCWMYLGYLATSGRNYLFNDLMVAVTSGMSLFIMYLFVMSHMRNRRKIRAAIILLIDYTNFGRPDGFDSLNANLNKFLKFSGFYGFFGTASYGVFSLIYRKECVRKVTAYDMHNWCSFCMPIWLPFDMNSNRFYQEAIYWGQLISCAWGCMGSMFVIGCQTCMVELLIFKIDHLKKLINDTHKIEKNQKRRNFAMLIKYHNEIINITEQICDAFSGVNIGMVICGSLVIGMIGFQCLFQLDFKNIAHASGWLLAFSFQCFSGQRLINASETLPINFYSINWYDEEIPLQKSVIFAIMRSNRHLQVTAFNYGVLSMITFSNAMQSAYSLLAMLSQTYEFKEENYD